LGTEITSPTFRKERSPMPAEPAAVDQPKHPLHALTTFELRDYRKQLESAIASCNMTGPASPARTQLQTWLDEALAEEQDRRRLADAR
jgi:hypothetical protein